MALRKLKTLNEEMPGSHAGHFCLRVTRVVQSATAGGMDWYDLYKEFADELEQLHVLAHPKPPLSPGAKTVDQAFAEIVAAEKAHCLKIDALCVQHISTGRKNWPMLMDAEMYFVILRYANAVRIAAALSTNTSSQPNQRPFPLPGGNCQNQIEWLLVVSWDMMGREWWKNKTELEFYQDVRRQNEP